MNSKTLLPEIFRDQPAARALESMLEYHRLPHAILLVGASTHSLECISHYIANAILKDIHAIKHPNCFILKPAGKMRQISAEPMRTLINDVAQASNQGSNQVCLVSEADRLHRSAANIFLKTLEEPPAGTFLILTTTRFYEVLPTLRSRCTLMRFTEAIPALTVPEWIHWSQCYSTWLSSLVLDIIPEKAILDMYKLLESFEAVLKAYTEPLTSKSSEEGLDVDVASHTATVEKAAFSVLLQSIIELSEHTLLDAVGPAQATVFLDKALRYVDTLILLKDANLNNTAFIEAFLLYITRIIKSKR